MAHGITESLKQTLEITTLIFAGSFCSHHAPSLCLDSAFCLAYTATRSSFNALNKPFQQYRKRQKAFKSILFSASKARALRISIKKGFFEPNKILTGDGSIIIFENLTNQIGLRGRPRDFKRERSGQIPSFRGRNAPRQEP